MCRGTFEVESGCEKLDFGLSVVEGGGECRICDVVCIPEILRIVHPRTMRSGPVQSFKTYWSVVSLNCISEPSGAVFACEGTKIGLQGVPKSVTLGGGSL